MSSRRWLVVTIAAALAAVALVVGANSALDIYGLFRDPTGRALPVYGNERVAKYLLGRRYVQANFDGVLIGSSVSANWSVGTMHSARLYNESVNGGNRVEEETLLDQVLENGGARVAPPLVPPVLAPSHQCQLGALPPRPDWGGVGMLQPPHPDKNGLQI